MMHIYDDGAFRAMHEQRAREMRHEAAVRGLVIARRGRGLLRRMRAGRQTGDAIVEYPGIGRCAPDAGPAGESVPRQQDTSGDAEEVSETRRLAGSAGGQRSA